jgi:hypothetical protein
MSIYSSERVDTLVAALRVARDARQAEVAQERGLDDTMLFSALEASDDAETKKIQDAMYVLMGNKRAV